MAIINEIKCARCDRKYSGVRSRCPYCGARRIGRGKYSENSDNAKGKMLISVLIMAAFTVAAGVLLFTTPVDAVEPEEVPDDDYSTSVEDEITTLPGLATPSPIIDDPPEEIYEPEPPLTVTSVQIRYGDTLAGAPHSPREITIRVGSQYEFRARVEPPGIDDIDFHWESTNTDAFDAVAVDVGGVGVRVTGLARGSGYLVLTVGEAEDRFLIRVA
ncbi:MAG: hypothetical protein FWC13_05440 [Oscillospiraceae bacterium]|nr:hypothetical protein [Oscillospiraceae bacterium]